MQKRKWKLEWKSKKLWLLTQVRLYGDGFGYRQLFFPSVK